MARYIGIAVMVAAVALAGCHSSATPTNEQGNARAATPRARIAADRVAENLAYRAYYNRDAAALATLKVQAKTNPAYLWGLSVFYKIKLQHFGLDSSSPILTKAVMGLLTPRAAEHERKTDALIAEHETAKQKSQERFLKTRLRLLEQAAAKNDPAAENALAGEYWGETNISMDEVEAWLRATHARMIKMRSNQNQAWFTATRKLCTNGVRLAQKSLAAGWPGAYTTLALFHVTPKSPIDRTSSAMTPTAFMLAAHCDGQPYPSSIPAALRNHLFRKAAQLGSVRAIGIEAATEVERACSGNGKPATRWVRQLKKLAAAGNVRAQINLKSLDTSCP